MHPLRYGIGTREGGLQQPDSPADCPTQRARNRMAKQPVPSSNIVFCFPDQERWDAFGCCGHWLQGTRNLEQMAADDVWEALRLPHDELL